MSSPPARCRSGWAAPLAAAGFLVALYGTAYEGDLRFWSLWMSQLDQGGYAALDANYPPLLPHWLWLLGKLLRAAALPAPPQQAVLLKLLVLFPVLLVHIGLAMHVERRLCNAGTDPLGSPLFWGTALNPALLLDGPLWGQVDLLPFPFLWGAVLMALEGRSLAMAVLFALALLTKFQAIVLAPLLLGLALHQWRRVPAAALAFGAIMLLGFLPFYFADTLGAAFQRAYSSNVGLYPFATFNAANLWYLVAGNQAEANRPLAGGEGDIAAWLTPQHIGLALFAAIAAMVVWRSARRPIAPDAAMRHGAALLLGFFAFAPLMHERYLFLLVPFTALAAARGWLSGLWYGAATAVVVLNLVLVLPPQGERLWQALAAAVVLLALAAVAASLGFRRFLSGLGRTGLPLAIIVILSFGAVQASRAYRLSHAKFDNQGRLELSRLSPLSIHQQWGVLQRDSSVSGGGLRIGQRAFEHGLGTHAASVIRYAIPGNAASFHTWYGLDAQGRSGRVRFRILLDDKQVWASDAVAGGEPQEVSIPLNAAKFLTLEVDPLGDLTQDHADWAEAVFLEAGAMP